MTTFPDPGGLPANISFPSFRYEPWDRLESGVSLTASQGMMYNESTWNLPGSSPVEIYSWETLHTVGVNVSDATSLGWDESSWDCYANHFEDYTWLELEEEGVQQYWKALGWTRRMWLELVDGPESEEKGWADLTDAERAAAGALCFFEYTWDGDLPLPQWQFWLDNPVSSTTTGSNSNTVASDPTLAPTLAPTTAELNGKVVKPNDSSVAATIMGDDSFLALYTALCALLVFFV